MENQKMMNNEKEEEFNKFFRRIKEETRKILDKGWDSKKCKNGAAWLLAKYMGTKDEECAEEAATYMLAARFIKKEMEIAR